jgi:hypothetical protein
MTITLDAVVFWKLRAITSENQRHGMIAVHAQEAAKIAQQRQDAFVAELAQQHGFDPKVAGFFLDDAACTLTIEDAPRKAE